MSINYFWGEKNKFKFFDNRNQNDNSFFSIISYTLLNIEMISKYDIIACKASLILENSD